MKKSTGREFFEVFGRASDSEKPRSWWSKKSQPETAEGDAAKPRAPRSRRDTTTPPGRIALTFSHEAVAVYAVVAILMLVGAFVWGYSTGREHSALVDNTQVAPRPENQRPVGPVVAKTDDAERIRTMSLTQPPKEFWTLRAIELPNQQRAQEVAAYLTRMGYEAFVLPAGRGTYSVNIGRFADTQNAQAKELKEKVKALSYNGAAGWFRSCSWHKEGSSR